MCVPLAASALRRELRAAVAARAFEVHYQPKICLKTGDLDGVEALLRWRTSSGIWVPAAEFTAMLEQMELIEEVGCWVFEQAAADCEFWRSRGRSARRVAINVSPLQLRHGRALSSTLRICNAWRPPDTGLDIELTESAFIDDSDELVSALKDLAAANVLIALDDFGCGYSSLRLLSRLPVRHLKIDRYFTAQLGTDERTQLIVGGIIRLAQSLDIETVAEGIETSCQVDMLNALGCQVGQGFYFSRPLPRERVLPLLPGLNRPSNRLASGQSSAGSSTPRQGSHLPP